MASVGGYDDLNRKNAVTGFFTNVDHFTREAGLEEYVGVRKEITRRHWKPVPSNEKCFAPSCKKPFSVVFDRHHHCRKCGEAFCQACTLYKRRLNSLAHFDPDGQLYRVCKSCFEKDVMSDGEVRSHTSDFMQMRSASRRKSLTSGSGSVSSIWRSPTCFTKECQRLLDGFSISLTKSEIMKTLREVKSVVSVPDWMKSGVWLQENTASKCRVCMEGFHLMKKKHFCVVCGVTVCKVCSSKDLLLYVPDEQLGKGNGGKTVKMAVIRIVGCPEVEPEISLHLRVCPTCKEKLISRQVEEVEEEDGMLAGEMALDFMTRLDKLHQKFHLAEAGVRKQLPNYTNVVESLEDSSKRTGEQSNMKVLAKAQEDLADALAHHVTLVQLLKKMAPATPTQTSLLKTYIRVEDRKFVICLRHYLTSPYYSRIPNLSLAAQAKCEFYLDNMAAFRLVKSKLGQSVPAASLDFIQRIMDKNAIISTHLALRQLVYEVLHLTQSHDLENDLPSFLITVEQEIEKEVKSCLRKGGEDVKEHMELVKDMTRTSIKDHKLIRISRRAIKWKGSHQTSLLILSRCEDILNQVVNQLQLASANRSFQDGKRSLDEALSELKGMKDVKDGFVMVGA